MQIIKTIRRFTMAGVVVALLSLNLATITFGSVALILSAAVEAVTGVKSATTSMRGEINRKNRRITNLEVDIEARNQRLSSTRAELDTELRAKNTRIRELEVDIGTKNRRIAALGDEVADSRAARSVVYRGERMLLSEAVENTSERVTRRITRGAIRNTGSVFGEALPLIGITVIVAATTWELKDACDTMDDLYQLDIAFNPENAVPADRSEVCGLKVPTKEEIWQTVKGQPRRSMAIGERLNA